MKIMKLEETLKQQNHDLKKYRKEIQDKDSQIDHFNDKLKENEFLLSLKKTKGFIDIVFRQI